MAEFDFLMPDVGEGLHEAEIVEWLVAVGETVAEDQPVVVVQTDKAVVDIPAPTSGRLVSHGGGAGDSVLIGQLLFRLDAAGEVPSIRGHSGSPIANVTEPAPTDLPSGAGSTGRPSAKPKASPATRKVALDLGIALNSVRGTGPGGRITTADVQAAAAAPVAGTNAPLTRSTPEARSPRSTPARSASSRPARLREGGTDRTDRIEPLRGTRRQIARAMTESWTKIPHVTELREIDAVELVRAHGSLKEHLAVRNIKLTYLPLFVAASVAALKENPSFNASLDYENEQITYHSRYNIGIAMSTDDGLVVPVIHDADMLTIEQLAVEIDYLVSAARTRTLTVDQLSGGTFTISNYGSYGTWMGTPIIRPPESAIVGFGRARDAVVAVNGQPVVKTVLPMAVSTDHRLNDGQHLGAFTSSIERYLSNPVLLLAGPSTSEAI